MSDAAGSMHDKSRILRAAHRRDYPLVTVNAWDVGSARLLASQGFESIGTSSGAYALANGRRDGAFGRDEMIGHAARIAEAVTVPVNADLENGFGHGPDAVVDTLVQACGAGLAGGMIEDTSGDPDAPILPRSLAIERVAAAVAAIERLRLPFVFTARTDVMLCGNRDLDEAIARLRAFEDAGAEVLCATGLSDLGSIRRVCQAVRRPVAVVVGAAGQCFSVAELADAGVRRISQGSTLLRVAMSSVLDVCRELREEGTLARAQAARPYQVLSDLVAQDTQGRAGG